MAGVWGSYDLQPEPVDAEVTILFRGPLEPSVSPSKSSRLDGYISKAQEVQFVPEPIRLKGVGTTTL